MNVPQQYKEPNVPLSAGARFIRGFTRIGAVLTGLVVLSGSAIIIGLTTTSYNSEVRTHDNAKCVAQLARSGYAFKRKYEFGDTLDYEVAGCSDSGLYGKPVREVIAIADAPKPTFVTGDNASNLGVGLIITGICAVVTYLAFWCVGWLCAGFTRDA